MRLSNVKKSESAPTASPQIKEPVATPPAPTVVEHSQAGDELLNITGHQDDFFKGLAAAHLEAIRTSRPELYKKIQNWD